MPPSPDTVSAFIRANLPLAPVPAVPEITLHTAHPGSRLRTLYDDDEDAPPPYWAYQWAGGTSLARHVLDHKEMVRGRRVLDLGAGSGIVAIAAAKAGASAVTAAETDAVGLAAIALNAAANGVAVGTMGTDLLGDPPPHSDLILVSDLFYAADLALRVLAFADRCRDAGIAVLVGDPFRKSLPLSRLELVAEYMVADFGTKVPVRSGVFSLRPPS